MIANDKPHIAIRVVDKIVLWIYGILYGVTGILLELLMIVIIFIVSYAFFVLSVIFPSKAIKIRDWHLKTGDFLMKIKLPSSELEWIVEKLKGKL